MFWHLYLTYNIQSCIYMSIYTFHEEKIILKLTNQQIMELRIEEEFDSLGEILKEKMNEEEENVYKIK